jgi:hypothetical protein
MTTEVLCRHFSRMGARLKIQVPDARQREKIRIDVGSDRDGEFFDLRCLTGIEPEILQVAPTTRHLLLMVRDGQAKNKFLLGHDERHWFVAAVPGDHVRDVSTAIASLRPYQARCENAIRQGEWFFVPAPGTVVGSRRIHRKERLSRGSGKPHICDELIRSGGRMVMVCAAYPAGVSLAVYQKLMLTDPAAQRIRSWSSMVRDAEVFARGGVRHPDHKTIHLDGWHRVYLNRERFAPHAAKMIAFLD